MKPNAKRSLSILVLILWQSVAAAEPLSLGSVLGTWRKSHTQAKALSAEESRNAAQAQAAAQLAERQELELSSTFEQSLKSVSTDEQLANREVTVGLSRRFVMFPSSQSLIDAFEKEKKAEQFEASASVRQVELQLARVYADLLQASRTYRVLETLEREFAPHVAAAERASRLGGLSHLAFRRWQLLQQSFVGEKESSLAKINTSLAHLSRSGSLPPSQSKPIPDVRDVEEPSVAADLKLTTAEVSAAAAKRDAASASLENSLSRREVKLSIEYKKSLVVSDERSVLAGIAIPLDGGLVRSSSAKEAEANLKVASQRLALVTMAAEQELEGARSRLSFAGRNVQIAAGRVAKTRDLYDESLQGFKRGQVDFAEVVESLKELHESELALVGAKADSDEASITYLSLTNQGPFADTEVSR